MTFALYRHFDSAGILLYVGITAHVPGRTKGHARSSHWFHSVAQITIEHFPSKAEAMTAEKHAVRLERPKHNVRLAYSLASVPAAATRSAAAGADHATGKVRGLLCHGCNIALGHVERVGFLSAALAYLQRHAS